MNLAGWPVARHHDLFVAFVQRIERVKKLLLNALFAREELDVINQQHIGLAVSFSETHQLIILNAVYVLISEFFRRKVTHARSLLVRGNLLSDRVEQMRLAQTVSAIKKERIVR